MTRDRAIAQNIRAHDGIADSYDDTHGEIFNEVEQVRLRTQLTQAMAWITTQNDPKSAFDCGCGSGNLTRHLLALGFRVVSGDVSKKSLRRVTSQFGPSGRSETVMLNGRDLSNLPSDSFDMVATYSVLHHVPDYLFLVQELARVTQQGGIVYIDHEFSNGYWTVNPDYEMFVKTVQPPERKHWSRFFIASNYRTLIRRRMNPRYQPEGDIHVWPDDHVEWDKVKATLRNAGCDIIHEQDYLLFKRGYSPEVYAAHQRQCHDTHVMIARKR